MPNCRIYLCTVPKHDKKFFSSNQTVFRVPTNKNLFATSEKNGFSPREMSENVYLAKSSPLAASSTMRSLVYCAGAFALAAGGAEAFSFAPTTGVTSRSPLALRYY